MNLNFLDIFSKNVQIANSMKIVQWERSCSMRTDRHTDMTKLILAFRNFSTATKNVETNDL